MVGALKKAVKIPIILHCHCPIGMATMSYWEGCRAGADILETSISPLAGGASLPATEAMVAALRGTPYDTGLDLKLLNEIKEYLHGHPRIKEARMGLPNEGGAGVMIVELL